MKKIKNYFFVAFLAGLLFAPNFVFNLKAQSLADGDCSSCEDNRRRAVVGCLRFGGSYENGEPAGWINFGDRFKCKTSQDSQCSGETQCQLSNQP